jgi:hypothetical protein
MMWNFGSHIEEVTRCWRKLPVEYFYDLYLTRYYSGNQIEELGRK